MQTRFISAGLSDKGHVRGYNEDAFLDAPSRSLWVVADGMGGHSAGDFASRMLVTRLGALQASDTVAGYVDAVEKEIWTVNDLLCQEAQQRKVSLIGATVVVVIGFKDFVVCGWAGDSRIYRYHDKKLERISRDHSTVQEMQDAGQLTEAQARDHPHANAITRAVGVEQGVFMDWKIATYDVGTQFLLCSDGVTKELDDTTLENLLSQNLAPPLAADRVVRAALEQGGRDNTTAIVLRAEAVT